MTRLEKLPDDLVKRGGVSAEEVDVSRQVYEGEPLPDGVVVVETRVFSDEVGGHFLELARFEGGLIRALKEKGVELDVSHGQSNVAVIAPQTERFGHLHPDLDGRFQDELWMIADGTLSIGLYDARANSPTKGARHKLVLSQGKGVFIPHGVVHGFGNYTQEKVALVYFASSQFSAGEDTLEWRVVPKDSQFWDFVKPDKI